MRLFIAIDFPETVKNAVSAGVNAARDRFSRANFSRRENYHLTLVFIGETDGGIGGVTAAMDACAFQPSEITVGGAGRFRRDGGDIVVRRVRIQESLFDAQRKLTEELSRRGFRIENREFRPHITVAREASLADGVDFGSVDLGAPITFTADSMTLFRSDRINGKLTYTPLYRTKRG